MFLGTVPVLVEVYISAGGTQFLTKNSREKKEYVIDNMLKTGSDLYITY